MEPEDVPQCEEQESPEKPKKITNMSPGAQKLRSWLNKTLRIEMTDGRILIGTFLCTDRDANVILTQCSEFLTSETTASAEDTRLLGLVMVPGKHIVSVHIDVQTPKTPTDVHTHLSQSSP